MARISPEVPVAIPDCAVEESVHVFVDGYERPNPMVVKYAKPGKERVFRDLDEALENASFLRRQREIAVELLKGMGHSEDVIPEEKPIIYRTGESITSLDTQKWFQDAQTLSRHEGGIFSLPRESLRTLRNIFAANVIFWRQEGYSLDMVGSTVYPKSLANKLFRHVLPVFFSENIVIDSENTPHFIDIGKFDKQAKNSIRTHIRQKLHVVGSVLSAGILDVALKIKR